MTVLEYIWAGVMAVFMSTPVGEIFGIPLPIAVVMVFGGLTLWLEDETFIKLKPTIVYTTFAVILFGGLMTGRPLLMAFNGGYHGGMFSFAGEGGPGTRRGRSERSLTAVRAAFTRSS